MTEEQKEVRVIVDFHLKSIAGLTAQIGIDSTPEEKEEIEKKIDWEYESIKKADPHFYQHNLYMEI